MRGSLLVVNSNRIVKKKFMMFQDVSLSYPAYRCDLLDARALTQLKLWGPNSLSLSLSS